MTRTRTNRSGSRPFPRKCHACKEKTVVRVHERRTVEATYDGRRYSLDIAEYPVNRCSKCGVSTLDLDADAAINRALREQLHLLQPAEIRRNRKELNLTQQQLADSLGCASESISRWESDMVIQSRSNDRLLRAFFHLPSFRDFLDALADTPRLGREAVHEEVERVSKGNLFFLPDVYTQWTSPSRFLETEEESRQEVEPAYEEWLSLLLRRNTKSRRGQTRWNKNPQSVQFELIIDLPSDAPSVSAGNRIPRLLGDQPSRWGKS